MNAHPFQTAQVAKNWHPRGFALVVTLSLMILLTVIAVSLLSMSSVSMRKTNGEQPMAAARANAKLGLDLALDELQKAAGPDQRITAAADILSGSNTAKDGRKRWVGVWSTNDTNTYNATYSATTNATIKSLYNPATPDTKAFVRWLVSSSENSTSTPNTSNLTMVATAPATNDYEIFKAVDASGNSSATNSVKVPKVEISSNSSSSTTTKQKHYYAYWVEDEGLKADLGWREVLEGNATTPELKQAARLSAAPGVDYGVFKGPFNGKVNYPITKESLTDNPWLANIDKALSPADMPLVMSSNSSLSNWLKSVRHDVTLGSLGVMADVKKGGLRRDLSLAFEMDGDADFVWDVTANALENPPVKFNQQTGEFVGNGDTYSAPITLTSSSPPPRPKGWPETVNERFLWRDYKPVPPDVRPMPPTPFADSIPPGKILRGPNWWALRDYANLYKRLSGSSGDYTLPARAYFPNRSSEGMPISNYYSLSASTETWDRETSPSNNYLYRPARANYAPVNLGTSILVSMLAKNVTGASPNQTAELAVGLDPLFYFWNPYNRKIRCENLAVTLDVAFPGRVKLDVTTTGNVTTPYDWPLLKLLAANVTNNVNSINFLIKGPLLIEPGEVVIASPGNASTDGVGTVETSLGYETDNDSGIIMTKLINNNTFNVGLDSRVAFSYLRSDTGEGSSGVEEKYRINTFLSGEQTQYTHQAEKAGINRFGRGIIVDNYVSAAGEAESTTKVRTEIVSALVNTKAIFGAHSVLIKPASPTAAGNTRKPCEMFARFNPAPMVMSHDYWARCYPNQIYRHVTAANEFNVINDGGIDFSGAPRNTFWGLSYQSSGSTSLPMSNIPSSPLFSLASFSNANLSIMGTDPFHAVGNSWSSPLILPSSAYGTVDTGGIGSVTAQDFSWLINDALFDRYYLSGIAPAFTINSGGYTPSGNITATLTKFFSSDYKTAQANPVLRPYLPPGEAAANVVTALAANDGYKKMGAYSLIDGAFNVNSTSIPAWTAFLSANRDLKIDYAQGGGSNSGSGTPFPGSSSPSAPGSGVADPKPQWSGFSRLTDAQISALATRIVAQVKLRGPFMSLSDFINHKMGTIDPARSYTGALQAAIDLESDGSPGASGINAESRAAAGGTAPGYAASAFGGNPVLGTGTKVTTGIPGDITQAKLLEPLAPRLSARSDTFRIRSYGEVRSTDGTKVIAYAMCEAVVQRVPEYFDPLTDAANNEPWDEDTTLEDTTLKPLNKNNKKFGRRFNVISFRWLTPNEI